jgi:hypothetical protein
MRRAPTTFLVDKHQLKHAGSSTSRIVLLSHSPGDDPALRASTMIRMSLRLKVSLPRHAQRQFHSCTRLAADHVRIVEVGPRDGLQNERSTISVETKIELIERLAKTGISHMEAGSFVPAKWVPQVGSRSICHLAALSQQPLYFSGQGTKAIRWLQLPKFSRA